MEIFGTFVYFKGGIIRFFFLNVFGFYNTFTNNVYIIYVLLVVSNITSSSADVCHISLCDTKQLLNVKKTRWIINWKENASS